MNARAKPVLIPAGLPLRSSLAGITLSSLCCARCCLPCVPEIFECHSCRRACRPNDIIYIPSTTSGLGVTVHEAEKVYLNVNVQFLYCLSCRTKLLLRDFPCRSCQMSISVQSYLYLSPPLAYLSPTAIEYMVRDTFKAEIAEYES
jgi:hypothetical protein